MQAVGQVVDVFVPDADDKLALVRALVEETTVSGIEGTVGL